MVAKIFHTQALSATANVGTYVNFHVFFGMKF